MLLHTVREMLGHHLNFERLKVLSQFQALCCGLKSTPISSFKLVSGKLETCPSQRWTSLKPLFGKLDSCPWHR